MSALVRTGPISLLLVPFSAMPAVNGRERVGITIPEGPLESNKTIPVVVRNENTRAVWYCVEVIKSSLHDPAAEQGSPIPVFGVRYRRTTTERWGIILWGRDMGGLAAPEKLAPGEEQSYRIWLDAPGYYRLELSFRDGEIEQEECGWELERSREARSRVFRVVPAAGTGTVSGTVAFVEDGKFAREVRNAVIFVKQGEHEEKVEANENGDYQSELPAGWWFLVRVTDEQGRSLILDAGQVPRFGIASGEITRFDVMARRQETGRP